MRTKLNKKTARRAGRALIPAGALWMAALTAPADAGPTIKYGDQSYLTIDYALQVWGQNRGYTSPTDSGSVSEFFLRRNRLTFSGQYSDQIGFYVQVDAPGDSKGGVDDKSIFYRDAYITIDYSDPVRLLVGRFKNTFTRENLEACFEPLTMDRAEVMSYTPFGASRDTGVALWGNLVDAHGQYRLMFANGRKGDNVVESSPRITARVHWTFFDPEYDYGYRGTYLGTKRVLTIGAAYDYQANVAYSNFALKTDAQDYKAWTADLFYEQPTSTGTYTISAAKMKYDTGDAINGIVPDPTLPITSQLEGYYVKGGYMLPNKVGPGRLQFFARYEDSQYHLASGLRDNNWASLGANYYLDGQNLKVSFEYASIKFDKQSPTDPSLQDYNQAIVGLQLIF